MPPLGDYLGRLISELCLARAQSDIESLRVAELYASEPLLRSFPVPRFRLPTVTLDVPVVIKRMEEDSGRPINRQEMVKKAIETVAGVVQREGERVSPADERKLHAAIDRVLERVQSESLPTTGVKRYADEVAEAAAAVLRPSLGALGSEPGRWSRFSEGMRRSMLVAFLPLRSDPSRLEVLVTTAEVREAGPRDLLAQLRLSISEDAMEWTMVERDGGKQDLLVPE